MGKEKKGKREVKEEGKREEGGGKDQLTMRSRKRLRLLLRRQEILRSISGLEPVLRRSCQSGRK